jgi:hypothetical protein
LKRNSKHLWKSVENLDDLHAAEMVQSSFARRTAEGDCPRIIFIARETRNLFRLNRYGGLIFLVGSLEIRELVVALEMPNPRGDFIDQIVIVGHDEHRPLITLQGNI